MKKLILFVAMAFCVNTNAQIITTVVGNGTATFAGDNGQATAASLSLPKGVVFDAVGNMYIVDENNSRIRKVTTSGVISTIAGTGAFTFSGDNGPATAAGLYTPTGMTIDAAGNFIIVDEDNMCIRKINTAGTITTIAGSGGNAGSTGDGGQATAATLTRPYAAEYDAAGNLYITDTQNNRIRKVNTAGVISTIAGTGTGGFTGDNGPATAAELNGPDALAFDAAGNLYIADAANSRVRMINTAGVITTYAGTGVAGYNGDGIQATAAKLNSPDGVVFDASGNLYIADENNNRIRKVIVSTGIISTIVGSGVAGFSGDGGLATVANIHTPVGMAFDANGNLYFADASNNRIRMLSAPCPVIIKGTTDLCLGNGTILTASGATSYTWSANAGSVNTPTIGVSPTSTTTYTVLSSGATCTGTNTVTVTVNTTPTLSISGDTTLCSGDNTTLTASGATSYTWASSAFSVSSQSVSVSPITDDTFTVTAANGSCTDVANVTIHVTQTPVIDINGVTTICSGNSTMLTASGASTYTWSANANNVTTNTVSLSPNGNTTYSVTGANGLCAITKTVTVNVTTTPTLAISGDTTLCSGDNTTLTASGATSYTWASSAFSVTTSSVNVSPSADDTFTVTAANGNCTDITSVTIHVTPTPTLNISGGTNICSTNSTVLSGSGATTYTWSANAASATTSSVSVSPTSNATYTLMGANNLCIVTTTINVNVTTTPTVTINGVSSACSGTNVTLTANGATTYTWSTNANNANTSTVTINSNATNSYSVIGANGNCTDTSVAIVTIIPLPIITSASDTICTGQATLHVSGASTYTWNPTPDFSNGNGSSVIYSPTLTTTYTITGTATTTCIGTTTVEVVVDCNIGITTFKTQNSTFQLYPNPAQNNFTVEVSNNEKQFVNVFDVNGKLVLSQTINGSANIDASNLLQGIYNVNISNAMGIANKRLVIVK